VDLMLLTEVDACGAQHNIWFCSAQDTEAAECQAPKNEATITISPNQRSDAIALVANFVIVIVVL